jgi:hypothetical protein
MLKAIGHFGGILPNHIGRRMAIIAGGDGAVAGLTPAVVLLLHDVTVGASGGVVGQIRSTFGIGKRKATNTHSKADQGTKNSRHQ